MWVITKTMPFCIMDLSPSEGFGICRRGGDELEPTLCKLGVSVRLGLLYFSLRPLEHNTEQEEDLYFPSQRKRRRAIRVNNLWPPAAGPPSLRGQDT